VEAVEVEDVVHLVPLSVEQEAVVQVEVDLLPLVLQLQEQTTLEAVEVVQDHPQQEQLVQPVDLV
jgi:hypothetical protein|tara:strand:+ start:461 stop:655 length:195 start_codon:yes stop_codon:yes gene_type:complete